MQLQLVFQTIYFRLSGIGLLAEKLKDFEMNTLYFCILPGTLIIIFLNMYSLIFIFFLLLLPTEWQHKTSFRSFFEILQIF